MSVQILFFVIFTIYFGIVIGGPFVQKNQFESYLGDQCILRDGLQGICQKFEDCEGSVKELVLQKKFSEISLCAFDRSEPVICCENITQDITEDIIPAPSNINTPLEKLLCKNNQKGVQLSQNIIGEDLANVGEFKHHAVLGYQKSPQSPIEFNCGGAIITDRLVLTAAHCVNLERPKIVRLGRVSLKPDIYDDAPVVDVRVHNVTIHPKYSRATRQNDIALIHLNKAVKFSDYIQPICLSPTKDLTHKNMTVTGFGYINVDTNKRSNWLKKAVIQGAPFDECRATIREANHDKDINDTQFCALGINGEDACKGDSGGPVIYEEDNQQRLYGIVSFSIGCGGIPGVFTKIDKFHEWIEKEMLKEIS